MTEALITTTVICRNKMRGPTVIASDMHSTHEVVFAGADDPSGEDVKEMPPEIVRTPQFRRALRLGVLEVVQGSDDPHVVTALQSQSDAFWLRAAKERDDALAVLEAPQDNDLVVVNCIGPGTRPGAVCGEDVPVRQREAMGKPPLCGRHEGLTGQCVRRGDGPWQLLPE